MNRFKNRLVSAGLILATLSLPLTADEKPNRHSPSPTTPPAAPRPTIEVAFVLDTTGSMGGLLDGAKKKIWSIVNRIASAKPSPRVKLALVAYRDKGDAYVTKRTDLTEDIDAVFADLMALTAGGGGDHPEHVNQALHEAVSRLSWSQAKRTYRVLFLVGDAPPHEYKDDV
ncbi:MAG: vWA domain-containing protein, partial [Planctomycetota bacterium]|nr:vWA domain-containing protein [Planctomycetota bacterium]